MATAKKYSDRGRGFQRASGVLAPQIREAGESRGFAVTRILTHWSEIAGAEIAAQARPVEVTYGRDGLGATLTVLTTGAWAPMIEMQKERLRERVNACYGYSAISRIRLTQTSPTGFSEGRAEFTPAPAAPSEPRPETLKRAHDTVEAIESPSLRAALEALGTRVYSRTTS